MSISLDICFEVWYDGVNKLRLDDAGGRDALIGEPIIWTNEGTHIGTPYRAEDWVYHQAGDAT
jgi:hypothetical protein